MAATAYSVALLGGARLPAAPRSALLPRRTVCQLRLQDAPRLSLLRVKAASEDTSASGDELIEDLKAKWDAVEDKPTVLLYGGGAIVALWLTSVVVGAINAVPLLPKILELVGLGYTGWFVYRYLLFKESRKELATDIETLKKKIAGTE
ncbi:Protein CURVATURE THYLAKOID 1A, chloroplastic [Dichanthelium oligosanthes]|uniref:Protein CURVATURE THYLAKOID 1A, chloroplastic n=1 Tax=Dichanthelium oligosanthes TaxID=888268 RepID=A0A1E5V0A0_9POAL|nr:Protein CURVATURE THYLAKOID 1A, chloroplastic [Dichanthelium oligosanthes]